ncbi:hypothetical protein [Mycobacterium lepromatosis]|uniref:hypothetical protein n=1 Tax=Mycobacterium lepromatosis TaxID=480418 RepID=UPI001ED9947B|nr:hypothetical protein [Mycobacterium lepromatosis]
MAVCLVSVVFEVVRTRQLRVLNPTRQISGFIMERDLCFLDAPPPKNTSVKSACGGGCGSITIDDWVSLAKMVSPLVKIYFLMYMSGSAHR